MTAKKTKWCDSHRRLMLSLAWTLALVVMLPLSGLCTTHTFYPLADALVDSSHYGTTFGTNGYLQVSNLIDRSYLKFDTSTIPADEIITGGTLHLLCYYAYNYPVVDLYSVPATPVWGEDTITWNNQPGFGAYLSGTNIDVIGPANKWFEWYLSAGDLPKGEFSLGLRLPDENINTYTIVNFESREISGTMYDPYLTVETTVIPLPGAVWLLGSGLLALVGLRKRMVR